MTRRGRNEALTPRQHEILELLAKGLTNEEIGGVLQIASATVKTHVTALMTSLDVTNRTEAAAVFHAQHARIDTIEAVLARPAIATLPLIAVDDDPRTKALARALSYDLSALFASSCWFPVIAQVSADNARGLGATCKQIGESLGARFLVDGSLYLRGATWRLAVRIDDVQDGACLWSTQRDFAADALFDVQDELCAEIVATAYPVMVQRVQLGVRPRVQDMAAWELAHQGMALCQQREAALAREARARFEASLAREPTLVLAHFGLGLTAYDEALNQWDALEASRERLLDAAERCIALAPHMGEGYFLRARYDMSRGDHVNAVLSLECAIAKNPSFAQAHAVLAQELHLTGHSDEALVRMRHALRLGPRAFVAGLAILHLMRHEYAEALEHAEAAVAVAPRYTFARVVAATCAHELGDHARAAEHARRLARDYPPFVPTLMLRNFGPDVDVVQRIGAALSKLT